MYSCHLLASSSWRFCSARRSASCYFRRASAASRRAFSCCSCCRRICSSLTFLAAASLSCLSRSSLLCALAIRSFTISSSFCFAASNLALEVLIEVSAFSNLVFDASSLRSFISFSILLSCLALSFSALTSSLSSTFLYSGDSIQVLQLFFCLSAAASAAEMLAKASIASSYRFISLWMSNIDDPRIVCSFSHFPKRSRPAFRSMAICIYSMTVPGGIFGAEDLCASCAYAWEGVVPPLRGG
jgi:hypothetical protein